MNKTEILQQLLSNLWLTYRSRVSYANKYVQLIEAQNGNVVNDHIAFRTLNTKTGNIPAGIEGVARIFKFLGYTAKGEYTFADKHLYAQHFEHPGEGFPKIFISQLEVGNLPPETQILIKEVVAGATDQLTDEDFTEKSAAVEAFSSYLCHNARPWGTPKESAIRKVNEASQYGAWTLLYGNSVNHFTAYINKQNVAVWPDLQATTDALIINGLPMKKEIEGAPGSKLRQTATEAVVEFVPTLNDQNEYTFIKWPYAYYELAERGVVDGKVFSGFLGAQATHLFEMTKKK